jgi:hypothetical protein
MFAFECSIARAAKPTQNSPTLPPADRNVPLVAEALRLADFAGMEPRTEIKDKLLHIAGFIQNSPKDGAAATESTEVWLAHTKTALYIVFVCHDKTTDQIRGHLARRENIMSDDYVSVILDPFHDHRRGIMFAVNPVGVQADAAWAENSGPDFSYDLVWDSEAHVTANGWIALMAIPFRSLRFPPGVPKWGAVFYRSIPRNSETDFWPRVAANVSGVLSQEATLTGIEGVTRSHNLQLNPYVLGQSEHTLNTIDPLNPFFSSRTIEGTAGGEVKAILKDSIVFDATINPDFSDVESDQPQFTVNQRYPVYFPELRPFFLENANYFSTPIQLVYTRNIVHPEYGIRVTGKMGRTNIGLFAIDDREPGETVAAGDPFYKKRALFAVGRVSRDMGKSSSIGLMYTDEEFGQGWNRIGGADFTWRANDHWTLLGQSVASSTKGTADSGNPPTYAAGPASYFEVVRSGHSFNLDTVNKDYSSNFQSQVGFIPTTNIRSDQTHSTYQWYPKKPKVIQSWGVETNQNVAFDHQGNRIYHYSSFDPFLLMARNFVLAPIGGSNSDTVGPQNGYLFTKDHNFTENFGGFVVRGAPFTQLNFSLVAIRGGNVNYNPVAGKVPSLMNQQTAQLLFTLQPIKQLTADQTYLLDRDHSVADGALVYESQVFRTKINYQFTRAISARVIAEYDSTLANPLETSLLRTKQIQTQALFTWLPHPGTAVYIGYNNDIQNLDRSLCNRLPNGSCDPNNTTPPRSANYLNDGRQFFVKASYLFRF